jgi:CRISPR-associated protein Csb1
MESTLKLRRYILGLSLVSLTATQESYLRQGCNLVPDIDKPRQFIVVNADGSRLDASVTHPDALQYARNSANAFKVGKGREEPFDPAMAERASEAKPDKLKGEVIQLDPTTRSFKLRMAKGKESELTTDSSTKFQKGKEDSNFESVVMAGAKVDVESLAGLAVRVAAKK